MSKEDWENFKDAFLAVKMDYEEERAKTPWYHNTHNCWLYGSLDELADIDVDSIDWDGITCYLAGRKEALEKLHDEFMKGVYHNRGD